MPLSAMQLRLNGQAWLGSIIISAQSPDAVGTVVTSTGALLRLAGCLAVEVDLIEPFGFLLGDHLFMDR